MTTTSSVKSVGKSMARKLVLIEWIDISTDHGWEEVKKVLTPQVVQSIGWVLGETNEYILLASDVGVGNVMNPDTETNRRISIPKGTIQKLQEIRVSKPRVKKSVPDPVAPTS